ncbi:hypothetical protein [Vibrio sonorensis]|uniref:hypothetical protein n=1 Tax=Vibrio sonorensis TaxID=1004316 RepID=UPI0008DA8C17|nr:hypothetical protein [Vibrio sonorensis]
MRVSQILVPREPSAVQIENSERLRQAYQSERTQQEMTEIEIGRSRILMIDEDGNTESVTIVSEH